MGSDQDKKGQSEVQLLNSVAGTGALSASNLFNVKGWVAIGEHPNPSIPLSTLYTILVGAVTDMIK